MSAIRLLAVDIDGTLLDSRGRLPEAHRTALVRAALNGVAVLLVTGRSFHFARPVAELIPMPLTLIVNNGAVVKAPDGATLLRQVLPRAVALEILGQTAAFEDSVAVVFDREPGVDEERQIVFERMDWTHPNRRGYYEKNRAFIAASSPLAGALTEDPIQVMFNGRVGPMRQLADELRTLPLADRFSVAVTEYEARDFSLVDINGADCSKGTTLARWTAALGLGREAVMAVGDNLNDRQMLEFAGTAVMMGNAAPPLRALGFEETASNDENGLALAIERHVLG